MRKVFFKSGCGLTFFSHHKATKAETHPTKHSALKHQVSVSCTPQRRPCECGKSFLQSSGTAKPGFGMRFPCICCALRKLPQMGESPIRGVSRRVVALARLANNTARLCGMRNQGRDCTLNGYTLPSLRINRPSHQK